jgi:hypothetical protein
MTASTATTDTPLRQAGMLFCGIPAGGLAPRGFNVLFQVRFSLSGLRAPVSLGVLAVSSRTVMNNVG